MRLTGPAIGRAKSATYRTCDVVGLDTMAHVVKTMQDTLPDDPWHPVYRTPPVLAALVAKGALGQKTKAGFFRKVGKDIEVLDPVAGEYRKAEGSVDPAVAEILAEKNPGVKFAKLRASSHPQAQFLWAIFRDLFHYCAVHLAEIADNARDVDLALRWGFGWSMGPFEIWQAAGWKEIAGYLADDILNGRTLASVTLPAWVTSGPAAEGVHTPAGAYSAAANAFRPRSSLPVYRRQYFPDPVLGEKLPSGTTIMETPAVRMWHLGDDIGIVSFKSKGNTIGEDVLDGLNAAIERAERECAGLVLWQTREPFSLGANLAAIGPAVGAGHWDVIEAGGREVPADVAAPAALADPDGRRGARHGARRVMRIHPALRPHGRRAGVLHRPGRGRRRPAARRRRLQGARAALGHRIRARRGRRPDGPVSVHPDLFPVGRDGESVEERARSEGHGVSARAPTSSCSTRTSSCTSPRRRRARSRNPATGRRCLRATSRSPGAPASRRWSSCWSTCGTGGFISPYDFEIGLRVARVLCGGEVDAGSLVDEKWLLDLERREFMALMRNPKTQERIAHTLKTGKPLSN